MHARARSSARDGLAIALLVLSMSFGVLLLGAPTVAADTYLRGWITADQVWTPPGGSYVLTGPTTVRPGVTLTIVAGTSVKMDPDVSLFVEGTLLANGDPGNPITFTPNSTASLTPPVGIRFNASAGGSVSWSTFDRYSGPLFADDSDPTFQDNTITSATVGIRLRRSASFVFDNSVNRATIGILLEESDAVVGGNTVNSTSPFGIQASTSGSPLLVGNTVTNVSGLTFFPAVGIYATAGTSPTIQSNTVDGVQGVRGANALFAGTNGTAGGFALGILTDGSATVFIESNVVSRVFGGRGGDGAPNISGRGGNGGPGGDAAGIVSGNTAQATITGNTVTTVAGGRGGQGGGGPGTTFGGNGANGAGAAGVYALVASTSTLVGSNGVDGVTGGSGGNGGDGTSADGNGGHGGDTFGLFATAARNLQLMGNAVQTVRGGWAGNSTAAGGDGRGGSGGDGSGIFALGIDGSAVFHFNSVYSVAGGAAGRGSAGGAGGNGTGLAAIGYDDGLFNETTASGNWLELVSGGAGGVGDKVGGGGGGGAGLVVALVSSVSGGNTVLTVTGGAGGNALDGSDGGRGGDATGFLGFTLASSWSADDSVTVVTKGAAGTGPPVQAAYGRGVYLAGNASVSTEITIENGTIAGVGDHDVWIDKYTDATTINTPFDAGTVHVEAAATLTVRNYLQVEAYWPDGVTPVAGAAFVVMDNGITAYSLTSPGGVESWLLLTDRIYVNSNTPTENATDAQASYLAYGFVDSPRSVNMDSSHAEAFVMIDSDDPTSAADALPAYRNSLSFDVGYTASDGNGTGVADITLWYRLDGSGGWTRYATQLGSTSGTFAFTAPSDGTYEFTTIANDSAGNTEPGPSSNDTWTIVDTVRPGSTVVGLPTYETTPSFLVSWAPDGGVADIVTYMVQYNRGAGWVNWLVDTTATSGTFTADPAFGVYQFRSIATDAAGNVEIPPATNDTWTLVDTERPTSSVSTLSRYQTSLTFNVAWTPTGDSFDIATYRIDVNDNGAGWTAWIASTSSTSSMYTGVDGHLYQFRSIATDRAGNVETPPAGNDTWALVDVSPPDSRVATLQTYYTALTFPVSWGPVPGTTDIATYTLEVSDNGGAWTPVPGSVNTAAMSAQFIGVDGHSYAFRTLARDRAGNLEAAPAGNDTWTLVDVTRPFTTSGTPRGANVDATPAITITFSEPMDRASVEQAFSLSPAMDGQFAWSSDSRTVTWTPNRGLEAGTRYVVAIDSSARDLAGNTATGLYTFDFTTTPAVFGIADLWWVFAAVGAAIAGILFFVMRTRGAAARSAALTKPAAPPPSAPVSQATIDDVFLLYRDGVLIKHETRRLKPDIDTDILSGMLTAVQQFVKDSFRTEEGELDELTFGQMHILIGRGKYLILAAMIQGDGTESFTAQIKKTVQDIEDHHWDQLDDWDGDMAIAKVLTPYVKKLIRGDYL